MAEAHAEVAHATTTGLDNRKLGFWIFLGSETLFFGSFISAYMAYKNESIVGPYTRDVFDIPLTSISTFVLLMSSLAMVLGLAGVQQANRKMALTWLGATIVLGATFLGFQAFEFTEFYHHGLTIQTNLLGSTFFILTGFHGAHVTVGAVWLLSLWMYSLRRGIPPSKARMVEIAGLYWHFVDVVWIVIFTVVYLAPTALLF